LAQRYKIYNFAENKNAMNRLFSYNPTLLQAWGITALTILVQAASGIAVDCFMPAAGSAWHLLLSYVLCFVLMVLVVMQLGQRGTGNGERETGNGEWGTENGERGTGNGKKEKGNEKPFSLLPSPFTFLRSPFPILLLFFMPALAIVIEPLSMWIPMPEAVQQLFEAAFKNDMPTFLSAVVAAPLAEEWLCRGVILKGLLTHYSPRKAIVWSAVLFGMLHMNPWQAIPAFCLGLAIGWVYWLTRSLWPCIFMHAVNNGLAFLLLLLFPDASSDATLIDIAGSYYAWIYAAAVICSVLTGYGIWRMGRKNYLAPDR
jgi:membrane protease YdiL (CAAX protease family)